jgi:hypothetical protein
MPVKGSTTIPLHPMVEDQGISITSTWLGDADSVKLAVLNMRMREFTVSTGIHLLWWLQLLTLAPSKCSTIYFRRLLLVIGLPLPCKPSYVPKTLTHLGGRKQ